MKGKKTKQKKTHRYVKIRREENESAAMFRILFERNFLQIKNEEEKSYKNQEGNTFKLNSRQKILGGRLRV